MRIAKKGGGERALLFTRANHRDGSSGRFRLGRLDQFSLAQHTLETSFVIHHRQTRDAVALEHLENLLAGRDRLH